MTTKQPAIPPYVYASVLSSYFIISGIIWDISWHTSIGRDRFFAPPHDMVLAGVVFIALYAGYMVIRSSFFSGEAQKQAGVKFWWVFYGSLGSLFTIWGAFALITSFPFDNWWHQTYGLDVLILSPTHTLAFAGSATIQFGAMVTVMAHTQNATEKNKRIYHRLFIFSTGLMLTSIYTVMTDLINRSHLHTALCYIISGAIFPVFLFGVRRASPLRWAATGAASVYMGVLIFMQWLLPLFPCTPLFGPILNHITHYQPFNFPFLLVIPALAVDLIMGQKQTDKPGFKVLLTAVLVLLIIFVVQWNFGTFLLTSPAARGWVFGSYAWYFGFDPNFKYRYAFAPEMVDTGATLIIGLVIAAIFAMGSGWVGFKWGRWMREVRR